ncbi:hypothetical protein NL524_15805 [Klebsiella pneumoniae]|nr:hypothetical protein [Klebsiella pneumoniae]MCP6714823.1 hypothetical protein [Klebsiella pneumoniae]
MFDVLLLMTKIRKKYGIISPPVECPDTHFLPDQAHCCRCMSFYGRLPGGISCSRNQGTPQSAYRSRPQVGMCGTNNPDLPESCQDAPDKASAANHRHLDMYNQIQPGATVP